MAGRVERRLRPAATPGYWRQHVHKESARNTGSPKAWSAMIKRKPARDRPGALGWRRGSPSGRLQPATARHSANAGSHCAAGLTLVFRHKTVHRATVKPTHAAGDRTGDRV